MEAHTYRPSARESNASDPVWKQLEALEHVHSFLAEVQQEIKESRDLLRHMNNRLSPNSTTDAAPKITSEKTLQRDLLRSLSPTAPKGLLRTNTVGSTSTNPTTASVTKVPGLQQQMQMSLAHDYLLPDLSPHYRDIFAPESERQGNANEKVPKNANDLQVLYTKTTKAFSVGDILQGMVFETTTPEAHPQLHNEIVRESTGYFSVGVENLLMLVVTKDPEHVKAVLEPAHSVVGSLETTNNRANLHWLEHPMTDILHSVIALLEPGATDIAEIQVKANLLWTLLKNRRAMLGEEVNGILDFADGMVKEEDGERIFDRLDDFLHFPNVSTELLRPHYETGRDLCKALIQAFNYPFSYKTVDRQRLVNSANAALKDHFGEIFQNRRRAGFWSKLNSWFTSYDKPKSKRGPKFSQTSLRSRGSRMSVTHRRGTHQRSVHRHNKWTRTHSQSIYNRARPIGKLRNGNFLKQQSNRNKPLEIYKFRTTEKRFSKKIHHSAKKLTTKPMISRKNLVIQRTMDYAEAAGEGLQKKQNKRRGNGVITSKKTDQIHDETPELFIKRITSHTESYHGKYISFHRRSTNFGRQSDTTQQGNLEEYPKQLKSSYSNIKLAEKEKTDTNTTEIQSEYTTDSDNSNSSSTCSDEKEILDVNLLNRLLNVTAEESLENNKSLNVSIETDDDIEILKHLKEVLYDK
ncbi:unnamed protein product [Arctia plantaginis]|uniref:Uncharacterized protein n=1 Tax=Arctia plantaginis TaxID=874455 RepID=A0A8S1BDY6_ARCPL|nr:unnamed protein product [Arctia plantaginis]